VEAVEKVQGQKDATFIFGGSKVEDSFEVMKKWLADGRAKHILLGGAFSVLMLHAAGNDVGDSKKYLEDSGLLVSVPAAKEILEKYKDKIILPVDVGLLLDGKRTDVDVGHIKSGQVFDIGHKTIAKYSDIIKNSSTIVMNGPMGVYEVDDFAKGTRAILEAVAAAKSSHKVFSLLGGGHTISAIDKFNMEKSQFGYVSLSGKALIEFLCGQKLPGIVALDENERKFTVK
jgi:phosphoglycerate kinase